jgi:hypothetical protein
MHFLIGMLIAWFVVRRLLRARGWAHAGDLHGHRYRYRRGSGRRLSAPLRCAVRRRTGSELPVAADHRVAPEQQRAPEREIAPAYPVPRLQRAWVAGRITDEEYERGLDMVYADPRWH